MSGLPRSYFWLAAAAFLFLYRNALASALLPFVLAVVLASLIEPPVRWLHRRLHLSRGLAAFVVLLLTLLAGGAVVAVGAAALAAQVSGLVQQLPAYRQAVQPLLDSWLEQATRLVGRIPPEVVQLARANVARLVSAGEALVSGLLTTILNTAVAVPGAILVGLVALLATYFFSRDRDAILEFVASLLPGHQRERLREIQGLVLHDFFRYVRAQLLLIAQTAVLTTVGLWLLGVPRWLLAGVAAGLLDLLPVLGPGLLFVPWAIYAFLADQTKLALGLAALYGLVTAIRQVLEARVIGASIGVHPLVTLFALYTGAMLFGAKGLILAPLLLVLGKALRTAGVIRLPGQP